jgi:sugar (pentulose or hexulose) kinase
MSFTAVFDAGKSRLKLSVVAPDGSIHATDSAPSRNTSSTIGVIDVTRASDFLGHALARAASRFPIARIVPVGHGATAARLDKNGLAAPVADYEAEIPKPFRDAYERERPPFEETLSPSLPLGLNLGRQLASAEAEDRLLATSATTLLPWPQYWAWHLCGELASEVSSLGCHTDLWAPGARSWSSLARARGWHERFAPIVRADTVLGSTKIGFAQGGPLSRACDVVCGAHDSNAALFAIQSAGLLQNKGCLVSTGTWTITMSPGADASGLDPARDCLGNVSIGGEPVPTCRFMGGAEYARLAFDVSTLPDAAAIADTIRHGSMALPTFVNEGGPFSAQRGQLIGSPVEDAMQSAALATLYYALMVDYEVDLLDAREGLVFEGVATRNPMIPALVASLTGIPVFTCEADTVAIGAARLATPFDTASALGLKPVAPARIAGLDDYAGQWRARIAAEQACGESA